MKQMMSGMIACLSVGVLLGVGTCQAQETSEGVVRVTDSVRVGAEAAASGAQVQHVRVPAYGNSGIQQVGLFSLHHDQCGTAACGNNCTSGCDSTGCNGGCQSGHCACANCQCADCHCHHRWTDKLLGFFGKDCDHCDECDDCDDGAGCCFLSCLHKNGPCDGCALAGCYKMVYAVNPDHFDSRDGRLYSAQGYGIPITVPLAPNVRHTYNYGWGIPSSRLTPISQPLNHFATH